MHDVMTRACMHVHALTRARAHHAANVHAYMSGIPEAYMHGHICGRPLVITHYLNVRMHFA